jgi:hypothetical protein
MLAKMPVQGGAGLLKLGPFFVHSTTQRGVFSPGKNSDSPLELSPHALEIRLALLEPAL